eukprot:7210110-Pyramimonas_sp.AAC.1
MVRRYCTPALLLLVVLVLLVVLLLVLLFGGGFGRTPETLEREPRFQRTCRWRRSENDKAEIG